MTFEGSFHSCLVFQVGLDQIKICANAISYRSELMKPGPLQRRIIVGIDIIKCKYRSSALKQLATKMKANKSSCTGNENSHKGDGCTKMLIGMVDSGCLEALT